jgi:predicted esterase
MNKLITFIILFSLNFNVYGQNFDVPDSLLTELESKYFEYTHTTEFNYKIAYPTNYNDTSSYHVFLGLSGGNANEKIVNYCFYTLFDSKYLDNYITILPIGPFGRPLSDLDSTEINFLIADIMKHLKVSNHNWLVAGTSMGGFAAYNFACARPELFEGIITFPGGIRDNVVSEKWKNYKILLAHGELEETNWLEMIQSTKTKLNGNVKSVEVFTIEGQGHIISPEYNIDKVYRKFFIADQ